MATDQQVALLRPMINQPDNAEPWTDDTLKALIDTTTTLNAAAAEVWERKAAAVAHIVDISEGGSSRKTGDVYTRYLALAKMYRDRDAGGDIPIGGARPPRTREIIR